MLRQDLVHHEVQAVLAFGLVPVAPVAEETLATPDVAEGEPLAGVAPGDRPLPGDGNLMPAGACAPARRLGEVVAVDEVGAEDICGDVYVRPAEARYPGLALLRVARHVQPDEVDGASDGHQGRNRLTVALIEPLQQRRAWI